MPKPISTSCLRAILRKQIDLESDRTKRKKREGLYQQVIGRKTRRMADAQRKSSIDEFR